MKKVSYLILISIIFFMSLITVNAENVEYNWEKQLNNSTNIIKVINKKNENIVISTSYDKEVDTYYLSLTTYDENGAQKEEKINKNLYINSDSYIDYDEKNNSYILVSGDIIYILDDKLEIEQFKECENWLSPTLSEINDDYYVFIELPNMVITIFDKNLEKVMEENIKNNTPEDLLGDYSFLLNLYVENYSEDVEYYDLKSNEQGYKLVQYSLWDKDREEWISGIKLYDNNSKLVFDKDYEDLSSFTLTESEVYVIEEITSTNEECNSNTECQSYIKLIKYNLKGDELYSKKIKTMTKDEYNEGRKITGIEVHNDNLMLISNYILNEGSTENELTNHNPIITSYSLKYNIKTRTNGNGEIKVIDESQSGTKITYEVSPKEGYVLGLVKVMDQNGNIIALNSNKFTMPSSDTTIEATFLPKNPETKDIAIISIGIISIIGLGLVITNYKKLKFLK